MAVEAEDQIPFTLVNAGNKVCLGIYFDVFIDLFVGACKAKKRNYMRYWANAHARMETDIRNSE
jgi:hypothetical protein